MKRYAITEWCHQFIRQHIEPGCLCIDATAGNGNDTEFLCRTTGDSGRVLAFDIQECAVCATNERLKKAGLAHIGHAILDTHTRMDQYASPGSISCIMFNLGYLPGQDHALSTHADTSLEAIKKGLALLKKGGLMSVCIYRGRDTGFDEYHALLPYLQQLDCHRYLVILSQYYNRPNQPPIPVFVLKLSD